MAWPLVDFNKLLQEAYSGKGDPMDWYQLMARSRISRPQHDLLVSASPSFGQRIAFSGRPTLEYFQKHASQLPFPPNSSNALANPQASQGPDIQPAPIDVSSLPAAYPGQAAPTLADRFTPGTALSNEALSQYAPNMEGVTPSGAFTSGDFTFLPVLPTGLQAQMEKLYGNTLSRLNSNFEANAQTGINPILDQARKQFNEVTIPGIAERFTAMGPSAQRGSGFRAALGRAASNLETDLAALKADYNLNEQRQLINSLAPLNPYQQVYDPQPTSGGGQANNDMVEGWGGKVAPAAGKLLLGAGSSALKGWLDGGGATGAAVSGIAGALDSLKDSIDNSGKSNTFSNMAPAITKKIQDYRSKPLVPTTSTDITPEQRTLLDNISRSAAPGRQITPYEAQLLQAITGGSGGAGQDFQNVYQQAGVPLSYAQRMKLRKAAARARRKAL